VNFRDGHSALVTCYVAGVDVELLLTYEGHYYICYNLQKSTVYGSGKSLEYTWNFFSYFVVTLLSIFCCSNHIWILC